MKLKGLLCVLALCGVMGMAVDYPYDCSGSAPCDSACTSDTVNCSLSGSYSQPTSCSTSATGTSINCKVRDGFTVVAETTSNCIGCGSGGSGGGGSDPDEGGEFCDPIDPLWWVWCDPFPTI
jgi:hypothetical protein